MTHSGSTHSDSTHGDSTYSGSTHGDTTHGDSTNSRLADLLAVWLPRQRWFAAANRGTGATRIISDIQLASGDPELRHLLVEFRAGAETVTYQVLLGCRTALPDALASARIGSMADGRIAYDGAFDPDLTSVLLRGIKTGRTVGPLRFAAEPGADIDSAARPRLLPQLQSNTSIVFGDRAILKLIRRPYRGHHPDLEVPAALARAGSGLVATPLGWLEFRSEAQAGPGFVFPETHTAPRPADAPDIPDTPDSLDTPDTPKTAGHRRPRDEPTILAILSHYFPGAKDGWSLAVESVGSADLDFPEQAGLLGRTTARMHAEMAAAFGTSELTSRDLADLAAQLTADLDRAIEFVPELADHQARIRAWYADLAQIPGQVRIQRIHGDYHLGQVLRTGSGWVVLDFEGEPSVPLVKRRAFAPAQRDVAGMLRSFDYAGRHQALLRPDDRELQVAALDWVRACQDAFITAYAAEAGEQSPTAGPLLRALTAQKAVYEAVYEARHRPQWLPIPLAGIAEEGT